jgi:hypothetical protein
VEFSLPEDSEGEGEGVSTDEPVDEPGEEEEEEEREDIADNGEYPSYLRLRVDGFKLVCLSFSSPQ